MRSTPSQPYRHHLSCLVAKMTLVTCKSDVHPRAPEPPRVGQLGNYSVWSLAFSPDGGTLAIGIGSGRTHLWNVSYLANVLGRLCSQVGGSVTRVKWAQFVPPGLSYRSICP